MVRVPPAAGRDAGDTVKLELEEATEIADDKPEPVTVIVLVAVEPTVVDASHADSLTLMPVDVPIFMSKQHFVTLSLLTVTVLDCVA